MNPVYDFKGQEPTLPAKGALSGPGGNPSPNPQFTVARARRAHLVGATHLRTRLRPRQAAVVRRNVGWLRRPPLGVARRLGFALGLGGGSAQAYRRRPPGWCMRRHPHLPGRQGDPNKCGRGW
jgi:hypothetical protein